MNMVEKFKENKKVMEIKMEQASKLADAAADEFIESIESLVKNASEEDLKEFVNSKDEDIEVMDVIAVTTMFAEHHEEFRNVAVIGIRK